MMKKIGILIDDNYCSFSCLQLCQELIRSGDFEVKLIIIKLHNKQNIKLQGVPLLWRIFRRMESRTSRYITKYVNFFDNLISDVKNLGLPSMECDWRADGWSLYCDEKSIAKLREQSFDVLIRCNNGILTGDILDLTSHGILSIHGGDFNNYRGSPAGFWEIFEKEKNLTVTLQTLTERLDAGSIIRKLILRNTGNFIDNQIIIGMKANELLIRYLSGLEVKQSHLAELRDFRIRKIPGTRALCQIMLWKLWVILMHKFKLMPQEKWQVRIAKIERNFDSITLLSEPIVVYPKRGKFIADPFVMESRGRVFVFCEEYINHIGKISVYELIEDEYRFIRFLDLEDTHFSYPFVFQHYNRLYLLPECRALGCQNLYELDCDTFEVKASHRIIEDVDLVDSSIFAIDDKFYLIGNFDQQGVGCHASCIICYESKMLHGDWTEKFRLYQKDDISLRFGGIFSIEKSKKIYMILQQYGFLSYGEYLNLVNLDIDNVTLEYFGEKPLAVINSKSNFNHHIHASENYIVWDYY